MRRAVYIGGFGNGWGSVERVASTLEGDYDEIDAFTFSYAKSHPDRIRRAVRKADAVTHSAGMVPLVGTAPEQIVAFDPPLPTSKLKLAGRWGLKSVRMYTPGIGIHSMQDIPAVSAYSRSATAELIAHPVQNLGNLGEISRFDAVDAAIAARDSGIDMSLAYMDGDEYFQLTEQREAEANARGVKIVRMPGIHDEVVIRPEATLLAYAALARPDD
jgi:hypothetical protein